MIKPNEVHYEVAEYIRSHPKDSFQKIANKLGVAYSTVSRIAKAYGLSRGRTLGHITLIELREEKEQ